MKRISIIATIIVLMVLPVGPILGQDSTKSFIAIEKKANGMTAYLYKRNGKN